MDSARGLFILDLVIGPYILDNATGDTPEKIISNGTLFYHPHTKLPFAVVFQRMQTNLGVAWLPGKYFSIVPWIELNLY